MQIARAVGCSSTPRPSAWALAKGELGYSKVVALTRIATSENEAALLNIGLHGTARHVEKFVRLYRRAKRVEETEGADAQHENRGLTFWHEDDGTMVLHRRFPPEMGARILGALDAAMTAHAEEQRRACGRRACESKGAEALTPAPQIGEIFALAACQPRIRSPSGSIGGRMSRRAGRRSPITSTSYAALDEIASLLT